jgi:hypothetical protein
MNRYKSKVVLLLALLTSFTGIAAGCHYHDYDDHRHGYYGRRWDRRPDGYWHYHRHDNRYAWRRDRDWYRD